jgi:hypothetical protein
MNRIPYSVLVVLLIGALPLGGCNSSRSDADAGGADISQTDADVTRDTNIEAGPDADTSTTLPEPDNHRPEEVECDRERPPTEFLPEPGSPESLCSTDADCTEGENGRCSPMRFGWDCTYDLCFTDEDCDGSVCGCGAGNSSDNNVCYSGGCNTDSDCAEGSWCSPSFGECGLFSGVVAYFCRTPEDTCLNDGDCTELGSGYCMFSDSVGHWSCSYSQCAGK